MVSFFIKEFWTAKECRAAAEKEERLATAAEHDGDHGHALNHRRQAAEYREVARSKEDDTRVEALKERQ